MSNRRELNGLLPEAEGYQVMGYRYQHIEAMNLFDKVVAEHLIKARREELVSTHQER